MKVCYAKGALTMDFGAIYSFLFETYAGIGCLVGISIVICILLCIVMERRTRKRFKHREKRVDEDAWEFFEDDSDEPEK